MDVSFFLKGLIFGFAIAAPVGPIGILCIQRSLAGGWKAGILVFCVFTGPMGWWIILSSASSFFRNRMNGSWMEWINRISGVVLAGFGFVMVIGVF